MISIRCLDLDGSLSHSHGFSLISKVNMGRGQHDQVLEGVD
jgi:hypothetical protein